MISRLATGLRYPLSTLHERCCHRPRKTRFRLAGSAFSGRASNPLGHDERFLTTFILLSRTYPDASWAHARRKFFVLADVTAKARGKLAAIAPMAFEAVKRIDAIFDVEREINGRPATERLAERACALRLCLPICRPGCAPNAPGSRGTPTSPRPWTTCLSAGRYSRASSPTAGSASPTTPPSASCAASRSAARPGCSPAAAASAVMYTLIQTAKLNDIDPYAWLADVLARINDHNIRNLDQLLPWNWKAAAAKRAA